MSDEETQYRIKVKQEGGYRFRIDFELPNVPGLIVDEDPPLGKGEGPDPSRLLGAAVSQCLLSSLLFCMQKSRAEVKSIGATATIRFGRNEKKRLRIIGIRIDMDAVAADDEIAKFERCLPLFQDFCTVSQSVKNGIPIELTINGRQI